MIDAALRTYRDSLNRQLTTGKAAERSYYPALKTLLEALGTNLTVTIEATGEEAGIPDLRVARGEATLGFVECKDVGYPLGKAEKSEQLKRYRGGLSNLILTNFLEFRWYVDGEWRSTVTMGTQDERGRVHITETGTEDLGRLVRDFLEEEIQQVGTASDLAKRLAHQAQGVRDAARESFQTEAIPLEGLRKAFEETLLPGLSAADFADMYAQTLAYGLFAACFELRRERPGTHFDRHEAARLLPKTNPFLRRLFYHLGAPDELPPDVDFWLGQIESLLNHTDLSQISADFAHRSGREDPVVHFYETFLREYDPKKRRIRGVYYTPEPVVSYIVRSIDYLLREKFGRPLGLADPNVYILDPACGTGTFLFYVIRTVYETVTRTQGKGAWNSYVREHLLKRLFGFELLMAPYTIAHMKLAIQLRDLGYDFSGDERLGIYLTNTLEEARDIAAQLPGLEELVEESKAADRVKQQEKIMVVLGNPPYSGVSANRGPWITELIEVYKDGVRGVETQIAGLSDDYVKFFRFAQWRIEQTGYGIVALITNNTYLDGRIFRGMRHSLVGTFDSIHITNLHGDSRKREQAPDGGPDQNVFDIQQGVAISLLSAAKVGGQSPEVHYRDLWGSREAKQAALAAGDPGGERWTALTPVAPEYRLVPEPVPLDDRYSQWPSVPDMFGTGDYDRDKTQVYGSGLKTQQDQFAICFTMAEIEDHVQELLSPDCTEPALRRKYKMCASTQWDYARARAALAARDWRKDLHMCLYRPFDFRCTAYCREVVTNPRTGIMRHLLQPNLALIATRQTRDPFAVLASDMLTGHKSMAAYDINTVFPLYLYPAESSLEASHARRPNLNPDFVADFSQRLGLRFLPDGQGDLAATFGPEDVFYYAYAVFHSPTYRERYAEFLKIDFPRLPLTSDRELFAALVEKGKRLVDLHLMREQGRLGEAPRFEVAGDCVVEKVRYVESAPEGEPPQQPPPGGASAAPTGAAGGRVYVNATQYFSGVEPEVWQFHIGGYQVCEKWLKDRKGRKLSYEDIAHYQSIVLALRETRRLMQEIDETISRWPIE